MKEKIPIFLYFLLDKGFLNNLLLHENLAYFLEKGDLFLIYKRFSSSIKTKILIN